MGFAFRARPEPIRIWVSLHRVLRSGSNPRSVFAQLKKVREIDGLVLVLRRMLSRRDGVSLEERLRLRRSGAQLCLCKRVEEICETNWDCLS